MNAPKIHRLPSGINGTYDALEEHFKRGMLTNPQDLASLRRIADYYGDTEFAKSLEEFIFFGKDNIEILDKNDISVISVERNQSGKIDAELEFYSDAGEDFVFTISFEDRESFPKAFKEYAGYFDPNEHAEMWIENRNVSGVPQSVQELIDDAESIKAFLENVSSELLHEEAEKVISVQITLEKEALDKLVANGLLDAEDISDPEQIAYVIQDNVNAIIDGLELPEQVKENSKAAQGKNKGRDTYDDR